MLPERQYPDYRISVSPSADSPWRGETFDIPNYYNPSQVRKRRNSWFIRIMDELKYNYVTGEIDTDTKPYFVTLTYRDPYCPIMIDEDSGEYSLSLSSDDVRNFIKRLKFHAGDDKIRYFKAEEYGDEGTFRPHYHFILFTKLDFFTVQDLVNRSWAREINRETYEELYKSNFNLSRDDRRYIPLYVEHSGCNGNRVRYFCSLGFSPTEIPRKGDRCAQYIAKYVAKLPDDLKSNYLPCKRPRVSASVGLGIGYCRNALNKEYHIFSFLGLGQDVKSGFQSWLPRFSHTYSAGKFVYSLPRRYKQELFTPEDRHEISKLIKEFLPRMTSQFAECVKEFTDIKRLKKLSWSFIT